MHSPDRQDLPGTELLRLARSSIEHGLIHKEPIPVDCEALPKALGDPGATFTTLHIESRLRGCRGTLEAIYPLAEDVARTAFQAAFQDPRFDPVSEHEVEVLRLEVSVVSPLETMTFADEEDLLEQLSPGVDGLVIFADGRHATFLPTVWEMLPEPYQFLAALKTKCGLPEDYWSDHIEIQRYRTTSWGEEPD